MNKIALITGGSRGLGRSMAHHLAANGRDIILTYHSNHQAARDTVDQIEQFGQRAIAVQLDITQTMRFAEFVTQLSSHLSDTWQTAQIDFLINNAGSGVFQAFQSTTETQFDKMVDEHVKGPFFLTQALLPLIRDGGRILNVSSGLTRMTFPGFSAYASMKSAVETLSIYLARELGERRISVNTLAPGAIETDFGGGYVRDTAEVNQHLADITALGRVGVPDDVGGAVAAILADGAAWINAQRIEVSGGQNI
ncbi:short-chain dehydrogenase [Arenicella chitinivorans]|uniref:Short-chain dehydrogenase n=1 Tax=Arenicella chitinivorans TaxID=1329800 RepID=A0A918RHL3_9GAMM|nr:SDR family oxidoreductase [Arenicella chitinivorans]GHA00379.1 short-chain dehydrogenase [Arenicella chitinivorans]